MYEALFGMKRRPFAAAPVVDTYFAGKAVEQARQTVVRSIDRAEGPALVIGAAGMGKSLLLALLASHFAPRFEVAHLASGRLRSVRALLQNILFELKLPFRGMPEGELRLALLDRLEPGERSSQGLLLLVDEAHSLPAALLDEVRMLTNVVRSGEPRVRLVLAGDLRLEERLANPRLASFQQRIAARCYLAGLTSEETAGYVRQQLTWAGAAPDVFQDEALTTLHQLTDGVPRLVNQLCDHALILSAVAGERQVTTSRLEEAWADLQQLPVPQHAKPVSAADSIVEFGELEEAEPLQSNPGRVTRIDAPAASERKAFEQLDVVETHLAAAIADEYSPLAMQPSEVEITFQGPQHPFGDVFEEEEVVIDRYASLEAQAMLHRPHVSSREGREIAAMMGAQSRLQLGIVRPETSVEPAADELVAEAYDDPFDPASDPVLPEYYPHFSENVAPAARAASEPELVVVDQGGTSHRPAAEAAPGRAHRQEYRQLFARLRRGG